jgi:hypothetical protein
LIRKAWKIWKTGILPGWAADKFKADAVDSSSILLSPLPLIQKLISLASV